MKFKVKRTVSVFGVGTVEYHPGDVVEGPDEWAETNSHILEPIPEPKQTPSTASQTISVVVEQPANVEDIVKLGEEEEIKNESENRHAAADRRPKKR